MLKKNLVLYDLFKDWEYEKLNLKFCKYLLGVNKRSTNIAVLSELGRMPLFVSHITAMFTFLHGLENSDSNSLVHHALKESISLHTNKVNCWFSTVSCLREKLGLDLDVCKKMKLYKFKIELNKSTKKKLYDIYWHKIKDISINTGKLCTYFTYKDTFKFEKYLHKKITNRQILCKFRTSAHSLRIETGRYEKTKDSSGNYSKLEKENRIYKFCNLRMVEDEFHFLRKCPYIVILDIILLIIYKEIVIIFITFLKKINFYGF